MEYLHVFNSEADYNTARESNYKEPWVSATNIGVGGSTSSYRVDYNKTEEEKLLETPLTFEILSDGTINLKHTDDDSSQFTGFTVEYKKNDDEWVSIITTTEGSSISVVLGDTVQFRGNNPTYAYGDEYGNGNLFFSFEDSTASFNIKGNIMSLLNSDNFATATTLQSAYTFYQMFQNCTGLTDASKLILPATISFACYSWMFYNCTGLTTAPSILPATTLAKNCYYSMFYGCTSLTTAPALPATTLANNCYEQMFRNCTSLTSAPELPATTLVNECYVGMFIGCSSLTTAPVLPATTLATSCYNQMFYNCTGLTTAPSILPATTLAQYCYARMFQNCSLTTAPALPATTLVSNCYYQMFYGCNSLNYIKAMFTTTPSTTYTKNWVSGVASTGTFVKNSAATWTTTGINGVPTGWTVQTATS